MPWSLITWGFMCLFSGTSTVVRFDSSLDHHQPPAILHSLLAYDSQLPLSTISIISSYSTATASSSSIGSHRVVLTFSEPLGPIMLFWQLRHEALMTREDLIKTKDEDFPDTRLLFFTHSALNWCQVLFIWKGNFSSKVHNIVSVDRACSNIRWIL